MYIDLIARSRRSLRKLLSHPPFLSLARPWQGNTTCLVYHTIRNKPETSFWPNDGLAVSPSEFRCQMQYVKNHFKILSLQKAYQDLVGGSGVTAPQITITFDDGYRSILSEALPILEEFSIPCTIFITPGILDRTASLWWEELEFHINALPSLILPHSGVTIPLASCEQKHEAWESLRKYSSQLPPIALEKFLQCIRNQSGKVFSYDATMLTWEEVAQLAEHPLITLGSHTLSHQTLSTLTEEAVVTELTRSKEILEAFTKKPIEYLAYPIGGQEEVGLREFNIAKSVGYKAALSTRIGHWHPDHSHSCWSLPRIPVVYQDTLDLFRWKVSGFQACVRNNGRRVITI